MFTLVLCNPLSINSIDTVYTERYMGLPTPQDNLVGYIVSVVY